MKFQAVFAFLLAMTLSCTSADAAEWKPQSVEVMTPWAANVDPRNPLPEYPRPQMKRSAWQSLNGLWDYAIVPEKAARPAQFAGQILVPFPIESSLSGVKQTFQPDQKLWYRRTFTVPVA